VTTNTDAQGLATAQFTLGTHVGSGNNLVEASATGIPSTALFSASATSTAAALIVPDSGNDQTGATGNSLPLPFIAVVTDSGHNRIPNVPVTFSVTSGNGLIGGQPSLTVNSDADGRAEALLILGPDEGVNNNIVKASFLGNSGVPVTFIASGRTPGPATATTISGVVVDNSNRAIPGVTMRMFQLNRGPSGNLPQAVATPVQTNDQGQFLIQPAPVGAFKLMADGGTATRGGPWPTLEYDIVTVSGRNNTVGSPIYLPQLNPANQVCVSDTIGGTLTIPEAPGFSLMIAAGSATFPGGSRTGCVSVTPVNMDKVPMSPGFGQQPRFIVTIQPVGTMFNPPAAITLPNVDGLAPRAVTEMYSYDHDLAAFTAIGSATVSDDGSIIKSDPGVGVLKAGWHCGGDPNKTGSSASLAVTINPTKVVKAVGVEFKVTAAGTPPPDGDLLKSSYTWEIISTQTGDDPSVAQIVQQPNCDEQPSCTLTLKGIKGGTTTLRVHFKCKTTGKEATADSRLTIFDLKGVLTAVDNFPSRSTDHYGLAEVINLSFTATPPISAADAGGLKWIIKSGGGTIMAGSDGTGTYTAPVTAGPVVLQLEIMSGPAQGQGPTSNITIVAPSGAHIRQQPGSNLRHTNGFVGVGFLGNVFLDPRDVSFINIEAREGTVMGTGMGFYSYLDKMVHNTGHFFPVGPCDSTNGCQIQVTDTIDTGDHAGPFSDGEFTWPIPREYRVNGGPPIQYTVVTHHQTADINGTAKIDKGGAGPFSKKVNDPTSNY
jgi:hypothetical protein